MEYRFRAILQPRLIRFDDAKEAMIRDFQDRCSALRRRLDLASAVLDAGSPRAVMERGFSVVVNASSGKLIRNAADVKPGDRLLIRPRKGTINAVTESIDNE
jgi:exodeoxyribonuclease VII large subunit